MKFKEKSVLTRVEILEKLRVAVGKLEEGTFTVADQPVVVPEVAELKFKLKEEEGSHRLRIEIEWYEG